MVCFPAKRPEFHPCSVIQAAQGFRHLLPPILRALLGPETDGRKDLCQSSDKIFQQTGCPAIAIVVRVDGHELVMDQSRLQGEEKGTGGD